LLVESGELVMRVLVNGVAGFGGSAVARRLCEEGYSVRGIDQVAPSHAFYLAEVMDKIDYRWKNLMDVTRDDVERCDVVLHFAGQADVAEGFTSPKYTVSDNVIGTVAALEACRNIKSVKKFILASSASAVQRPEKLPTGPNQLPSPTNPYGASKGAQELMCWAWHRSYGVPITILRNGIIYGPNMRREIFIFKWIWNILHGKPCVLEGGDQTRDPTYSSDTLEAWMLAIEAAPSDVVGQVFQVSYGKEYTVRDILDECMAACGREVEIVKKPYRPGEKGMREDFDISKSKEILGYDPKVSLKEGLAKTVSWVKTVM
jgi:nucleoside-diphosphate-sugar epimerase